jgi:hypothetical protein
MKRSYLNVEASIKHNPFDDKNFQLIVFTIFTYLFGTGKDRNHGTAVHSGSGFS